MKEFLHRIFSCCMALLLLASTTSWKVEKHYCMGRLINVAFFVDADACGMDMPVLAEQEVTLNQKTCCDNEVILLEGQDEVTAVYNDLDLDQQQFLIAYTLSFLEILTPLDSKESFYNSYHPPKIVKDIQLLDEVYLL